MSSQPMACTWEAFDLTILSPLRVQMMGSVMVSTLKKPFEGKSFVD